MDNTVYGVDTKKVYYYTMLEFVLPIGTTQVIQIQNQELLTGARIFDIETFTIDDLPVSPGGNPVLTLAQLQAGYLQLQTSDPTTPFVPAALTSSNIGYWVDQTPLINCHKIQNGTDPFLRNGFPLNGNSTIYWGKSKILFPGAGITTSVVNSLVLGVSYMLYPGNVTN
jgi:hypothetical protein